MPLRRTVLLWLATAALFAPVARGQSVVGTAFIESRGVKIRYVEFGRGEPVVLIHGFSSSLDANWGQTRVIETLAKDFRVVALDVRGHGKSGKPHDPASYGTVIVDDVIRLLDHLGIAKAHLVGYSMGGVIAGKLVVTHPERVLSVVFGASAPRVGWPPQAEKDATAIAESLERGHGMRPMILRLAPPNEPAPSDESIEQESRAIMGRNDPLALAALQRANKDLSVSLLEVRAIRQPLLAIVGSADPIKAGVDTFKLVARDLKVVVIDGATHRGPRSAAGRREFAAAVRDFVVAHRSASDR